MKPCPNCSAPIAHDAAFCTTCGHKIAMAETALGEVGASLPTGQFAAGALIDGKYTVLRVLGEGGMGVVYLARSMHTDIEVVIKAVRPEIAHRQDIRERTLAEGKALARIDHPNVVQLKAVVVTGKELLLVMQYIAGESLEDRILRLRQQGRALELNEALDIFRQVLKGVTAAHDEGVIHRDLKPANILLRAKDNVVKVTDFGIAKPEEDAQSGKGQTKGIIGSVSYMSPEQVTGQRDLDRRVDIYSLGILLHEMLTGNVPYDADNTFEILKMHVDEPLPSACAIRPELPHVIDAVLQRACAKKRDDRYGSCPEFLAALEGIEAAALSGFAATAEGAGITDTVPEAPPTQDTPAPTEATPAVAQFVAAVAHGQPATQPGQPTVRTQPTPQYPGPMAGPQMAVPTAQQMAAPMGAAMAPPMTAQAVTGHRPGTITGQSVGGLPAARSGGSSMVLPIIAVALIASAVVVVLVVNPFAAVDDTTEALYDDDDDDDDETTEGRNPKPKPAASASAEPPSPLDALEGEWVAETGTRFNAVQAAGRIELRFAATSAAHEKQDFRPGDTRFVLTPIDGESNRFGVEERIRPTPPVGYSYDSAQARGTCLVPLSTVGSTPLTATLSKERLELQVSKVAPTLRFFTTVGRKIHSCRGPDKLKITGPVPYVLNKQ